MSTTIRPSSRRLFLNRMKDRVKIRLDAAITLKKRNLAAGTRELDECPLTNNKCHKWTITPAGFFLILPTTLPESIT